MFFPKDLAAQYLRKHGYNIVDRGAMPFKYGITTIDFVAYDKSEDALVAANIDSEKPANVLDNIELEALYNTFDDIMECVKLNKFQPNIIYTLDGQDLIPKEFAPFTLSLYSDEKSKVTYIDSISQVLEQFYSKKSAVTRIRQKSYDL